MKTNLLDVTAIFDTAGKVIPRKAAQVAQYGVLEAVECMDWYMNPTKQKEDIFGEIADTIICMMDLALLEVKERYIKNESEYRQLALDSVNDAIREKSLKWERKCSPKIVNKMDHTGFRNS